MNYTTLYKELAEVLELPVYFDNCRHKKVERIVQGVFKAIRKGLAKDGRVSIKGFGTFTVREYEKGATEVIPFCGKYRITPVRLPSRTRYKAFFKPSASLRKLVDPPLVEHSDEN